MTKYPTIVGLFAILIWSFGSLLYALLSNIPPGQITTLCLLVSFILAVIKISLQKSWHEVKQPWPVWICGFAGTSYYTASFSYASKVVPIEKVSLIAASTPIVILILSALLFKLKFSLRYIIAILIGFIGIYILTSKGGIINFSFSEIKGYLLAFTCAIGLSVYTLGAKAYRPSLDLIGLYCGLGSILALFYHLGYENSVMPTLSQWIHLFLLGAFINWLAYYLWTLGINNGNLKRLSLSLYFVPVLSISWLIMFEKTKPSIPLITAIVLVCFASYLATPIHKSQYKIAKRSER